MNAKELLLARINATPELMSMPIAMLTLGMDPKSVIDVCINLLDPIAKNLELNRLQNANYNKDVRKLISNEQSYDDVTRASLLKIFDFAQELRVVTLFFKINLGVTAQYVELLDFQKRLSIAQKQMAKRKGKTEYESILDLNKLFSADRKEYLDEEIKIFNELKTGINVIDIVTTNNNFNSMLESMQRTLNTIRNIAGVAKYIDIATLAQILESDKLTSADYKNLIKIYQDFIIGKALQTEKLSELKFTLNTLKTSLGISLLNTAFSEYNPFGLDQESGIELFMDMMDNYVIPTLREKHKDNFFMTSLEYLPNRRIEGSSWSLPYDPFNEEDVSELQNVISAVNSLREIQNLSSGLITIYNQELTIGDAFYLYHLISEKNQMSALHTAVTAVANETKSAIAQVIHDTYVKYDILSRKLDTGAEDPEIQELIKDFNNLKLILEAVLSGTKKASDSNIGSVDLNNKYLWSLTPIERFKSIQSVAEEAGVTLQVENYNRETGLFDLRISIPLGDGEHTYSMKQVNIESDPNLPDINTVIEKARYNPELLAELRQRISFYKDLYRKAYENIEGAVDRSVKDINDIVSKNNTSLNNSTLKVLQLFEKDKINIQVKQNTLLGNLLISKKGYVIKVASNTPIIVLDSDLLSSGTFNAEEYLDLLLQTKCANPLDVKEKAEYLANLVKEDPTLKTVLNDYLDYLSNNYPNQDVVQACILAEHLNRPYLDKREVYYRRATDVEKSSKNLIEGDIVTLPGVKGIHPMEEFLYVGSKDGKFIFKSLTTSTIRTSSDATYNINSRLRLPQGVYFDMPLSTQYEDNWIFPQDAIIEVGDKVNTALGVYTIQYVSYEPVEDSDKTEISYIATNSRKEQILLKNSDIKKVNKKKKATEETSTLFTYVVDRRFNSYKNLYKELRSGDVVTIGDKDYIFRVRLNDNTFVDTEGRSHNFEEITKIKSPIKYLFDPKFNFEATPMQISTFVYDDKSVLSNPLAGLICSINGYKMVLPSGENSTISYFQDKSNSIVYRLSNYFKLDKDSEISVGDVFIKRGIKVAKAVVLTVKGKKTIQVLQGVSDTFYKVISKNENSYEVIELIVPANGNKILPVSSYGLKVLSDADLRAGELEHYSLQNLIKRTKQISTSYTLSAGQIGTKLLDQLEDRFGVPIAKGNLPDNVMATFKNNKIIFNSKLTDEALIANEAVHELTHLAIAMLRLNDPDSYITLKTYFDTVLNKEINNNPYYTELAALYKTIDNDDMYYESALDKTEEKIVRFLDFVRKYSTDLADMLSVQNIINKGFVNLLNITIPNNNEFAKNMSNSIASVMHKYGYNFTEETLDTLDLLLLLKSTRMKKMLNRIKEYCV